ncbi:trehalose-phosphatase [Henriciella sp. AS95]|uniref:trehalose-phosphatase n=1 Tax=Henriciella sp. AS95 TaxID=3135782 RepID=UPI00317ECC69
MKNLPRLTSNSALFLDFDGTLAPIQDDPDTVAMPAETLAALTRLQPKFEAICIISGRDIRDLSSRVPTSHWRAGGHGLEICKPGETPAPSGTTAPRPLSNAIEMVVRGLDGVRIEHKGPVIAVHYRQAPDLGDMLLARLTDTVNVQPDYKVQAGKMVIEAKPIHANKGRALEWLMQQPPFAGHSPIMVGDDTTDEDAFSAANRLGGTSIKVGDGPTEAQHRLDSPKGVADWLSEQGQE